VGSYEGMGNVGLSRLCQLNADLMDSGLDFPLKGQAETSSLRENPPTTNLKEAK
jgi:hypothetical protein